MKKSFFSCCLTFAAMLAFSISTFAQHAGGGRSAGAGLGSTGAPPGVGSGDTGRPSGMGSTGMSHSSMGSQSPTTVLDNSKLDTLLSCGSEALSVSNHVPRADDCPLPLGYVRQYGCLIGQ